MKGTNTIEGKKGPVCDGRQCGWGQGPPGRSSWNGGRRGAARCPPPGRGSCPAAGSSSSNSSSAGGQLPRGPEGGEQVSSWSRMAGTGRAVPRFPSCPWAPNTTLSCQELPAGQRQCHAGEEYFNWLASVPIKAAQETVKRFPKASVSTDALCKSSLIPPC